MKNSNNTKQIAIVGVLAAVLLAVGAFQFMGPSPAPVVPPADTTTAANEPAGAPVEGGDVVEGTIPSDPVREALLSYATSNATPRDPFKPSGSLAQEYAMPQGKVAPASAAPAPIVGNPDEGRVSRPSRTPRQDIPAMNPMGGSFPDGGSMGLAPTGPIAEGANPGVPGTITGGSSYKVKGIIVGTTRMVVLEDADGNQKLVPEGGSVDGDTTVVKVQGNTVKISSKGRRKDVALEEERR